jgi:hypothetical protein
VVDGDMGVGERHVQEKTEATMKRGSIMTRAVLLLIVIGLSLSACAVQPGGYVYDGYPYSGYPDYPVYGSFAFDYGGWGGWHHGWDHSHWDHGGWHHGWGHGGWGHGFAHGGGGHGGGGHGGGGHR